MNWKPRHSAPNDGSSIDVWDSVFERRVCDVSFEDGEWTSEYACWSGQFYWWRPHPTYPPKTPGGAKYNHVYTVAFSVHTDHIASTVPNRMILEALRLRVEEIAESNTVEEAIGCPDETNENI